MLYLLYFTERGSVKMLRGWQRGLGIYTDCISCSPEGKVKAEWLYSIKIPEPQLFCDVRAFFKVTQTLIIFLLVLGAFTLKKKKSFSFNTFKIDYL